MVNVTIISPESLRRQSGAGGDAPIVIDARPIEEYSAGHTPGAIQMEWTAWCDAPPDSAADDLQQPGYWIGMVEMSDHHGGPGLLLMADDLSVIALSPEAERLVDELGGMNGTIDGLPLGITAVAARLRELEMDTDEAGERLVPRARVRTRRGEWVSVRATRMTGGGMHQIAVILDRAQPAEIAPLIVQSYGISPRESEITRLIAQGYATADIVTICHITVETVQDHCKSIFDKTGVRSRRELVAQLFERHFRS